MARAAFATAGAVISAAIAAALAGCLGPATRACGDGFTCPAGLRCEPANEREWCVPPNCGNGELDIGEACDDGNNIAGDGCPADCSPPCGDGFLDPGEDCDDGNASDFDGACPASCRFARQGSCGDGVINLGMMAGAEACDDGNLRNHDGCSSVCRPEILTWTTSETGSPAAGAAVMAYDVQRGVVVLVDAGGETWDWTGTAWLRHHGGTSPVPIDGARMLYLGDDGLHMYGDLSGATAVGAILQSTGWYDDPSFTYQRPTLSSYGVVYDAGRRFTVLLGRSVATGEDQTWEQLLQLAWRQRPVQPGRSGVPVAPSASYAMAYDPRRGLTLLYRPEGLWAYDGRDWNVLPGSVGPASEDLQLVYDALRDRLVVFGIFGSAGAAETWEWDGASWQRKATTGPSPRTRPAMTYDVIHRAVLLFGGRDVASGAGLDDTWLWNGSGWRRVDPVAPVPRSHHAAVYDARRGTTLLFGGIDASGHRLGDTWIWDGAAWRQPAPGASPPARSDHAMALDGDRTVLFGGIDADGHRLGDTWEWDGAAWHDRTTASGPPPRSGHVMAAHGVGILLFGGADGGTLRADQWRWRGGWTEETPPHLPPPRRGAALAHVSDDLRLVLFGGEGASGLLGDTWAWDGTDWTEVPGAGPTPRAGHSLIDDPALRHVVLFGGRDRHGARNDVWIWTQRVWQELTPAGQAPARDHHAMVYDLAHAQPLLIGGADGGAAPLGDRWTLGYLDPDQSDEVCSTGLDRDGDREAGCDDPDCEELCSTACGNGVCDPFESPLRCPLDCATGSVCGNWVCNDDENCASCPGDCGRCIGAPPEP